MEDLKLKIVGMEVDKQLDLLNEAQDYKVGEIIKMIKKKILFTRNEIFGSTNETI